ncbi:MAG: hypothetical protein M1825_003905 [Sarcosagium campestre]|nr:MAG: hypothetical protein M1825_003905 [Sarcosagium campestre]
MEPSVNPGLPDGEFHALLKSYPIDDKIDLFRKQFDAICDSLAVTESEDRVEIALSKVVSEEKPQLLPDLFKALSYQEAALRLPSRLTKATLSDDLLEIFILVRTDKFDTQKAIPILNAVIKCAPDTEIWNAAFELVDRLGPTTPPLMASVADHVLQTPVKPDSSSQDGSEQTHELVDQRIAEELYGCVYDNVEGFYDRYFEKKSWAKAAEDIYKNQASWNLPESSTRNDWLGWITHFQDQFLQRLPRVYRTSANDELQGSERKRKVDVFLTSDATERKNHKWSDILVVGELRGNAAEDHSSEALLRLAGYAREVYGAQPGRRFVHCFSICRGLMRLWMFDRSGAYSSKSFDVRTDPKRFVKVLTGYALMSHDELGRNTFIARSTIGPYVDCHGSKFYLQEPPIVARHGIVCRGTTCFLARKEGTDKFDCVVKLAWPSAERRREGELLRLAQERGVKGVAKWVDHVDVETEDGPETIASMRRTLRFEEPRQLSKTSAWVDSTSRSTGTRSQARGRGRASSKQRMGRGRGIGATSGQKRKRDEGPMNERDQPKRRRSMESRIKASAQKPQPDSTMHEHEEPYNDRAHCCLVTSPAGRPLNKFGTILELLGALRDAIMAHKSLLVAGNILHRDISDNNVIIAKSDESGETMGVLIDLDLATEHDSEPSGARHRTGTVHFMAIEVLRGRGSSHTYRHDLESFFYVFVWMCIRNGKNLRRSGTSADVSTLTNHQLLIRKGIKQSVLEGWYTGDFAAIATQKRGAMDKDGFEDIIDEFAPEFAGLESLARKLRDVLFPIVNGSLFIRTYAETHRHVMYDGMIEALNDQIDDLKREESAEPGIAGDEPSLHRDLPASEASSQLE